MPVVGVHDGFGQFRKVEEEEAPGLAELAWVVQSLRELPRMCRVEDGQPIHDLGVVHRSGPGDGSAPVVADQQRGRGARSWIRPRMSAASFLMSYAATPSGFDDRL